MITRKDVAAQLKEAALLLEVLGEDVHRARSLHSAARAFESFDGDVEELYREGRLTELRGVGARTETELRGMFENGTMPILEELREQVPSEVKELFAVSGLGAKRIGQLWRSGVVGIDGLTQAAEDGRLAELPGFGAKSVGNIVEAARFAAAARSRMRLDEAERLSEAIMTALTSELPGVRVEAAGEYRRGLETVGALEFVVSGAASAQLVELVERLLDEVDDEERLSGTLMGRVVRFALVDPDNFGAQLALRTGSDAFVATLHSRAQSAKIDLEARSYPDEIQLFEALEMSWVPPELREFADPAQETELLETWHLRGLVHNHSTWSDGALSIRGMAEAARELGFAYLAIADHSQSSTVANGLPPQRVLEQAEEVGSLRQELALEDPGFELLHGIEVDILADGMLDLPDEILAGLDYTVASVHQHFGLSEEDQTARIVRAVENPHVHILGHATGRLLLRRPGYAVDLERVVEACARTGTVIEINANPRRLDLDWRWARTARAAGCLFSINPDAHTPDGYDDIRYGCTVARKAGLAPGDVVNTAASGHEFLVRLPKKGADGP